MKNLMSLVLSLSVAALMASCGGGDDGPATTSTTSTSVVDKYVGTWKDSCSTNGTSQSDTGTFTLVKTSDTTLSATNVHTVYASTNCSGTPTRTDNGSATGTFRGTKTIGTDTVDKIDIVQNGVLRKTVLVIKNGLLFSGRGASDGGAVDSDGYPTTLETSGSTKQ